MYLSVIKTHFICHNKTLKWFCCVGIWYFLILSKKQYLEFRTFTSFIPCFFFFNCSETLNHLFCPLITMGLSSEQINWEILSTVLSPSEFFLLERGDAVTLQQSLFTLSLPQATLQHITALSARALIEFFIVCHVVHKQQCCRWYRGATDTH